MILSFNFGLYPREEMRRLPTHVVPIINGLADAGHRVIRFAVGLGTGPVINILPYHRAQEAAVDDLIAFRKSAAQPAGVGILCLDPICDEIDAADADDPVLRRLAQEADFIWTVLPPEKIPGLADVQAKVARLRYGFSPHSLGRNTGQEKPIPRDVDVLFRGAGTPRRAKAFEELRKRGAACFWIDQLNLPHYVTDDLLARSKVYVDLQPDGNLRGGSPALTAQALHNAAAIVLETGSPGDFAAYSLPTPFDDIVERCLKLLQSGLHAGIGETALQKFRAETSMRDTMAAVLRHPAFERMRQAIGAV